MIAGSPTAPRRLDAQARRDQIMRAAAGLFTERGFEAVGMGDVAAALQISRPAVYSYFPSTEAMLDALLDELLEHLPARLAPHLNASEPISFGALFLTLLQEGDLLRLLNSGGGPLFRARRQAFLQAIEAKFRHQGLTEFKLSRLDCQPHLLPILLSLLTGLAHDHLTRQDAEADPAALAATLENFIHAGIRGVLPDMTQAYGTARTA